MSLIIRFLQVVDLLGGDKNSSQKQMRDVIMFEAKLASIMERDEERRDDDKNYHRMKISKLQQIAKFVSNK